MQVERNLRRLIFLGSWFILKNVKVEVKQEIERNFLKVEMAENISNLFYSFAILLAS